MFKVCCLFLLFFKFVMAHHETVAVYAVDMKTGKVILDENSDKSMIPASCLKIVTTGAALSLLDPTSQFKTELQYDGEIRDGILYGNLYIKGGGDPALGSERLGSSWKNQVAIWGEAISKCGIQKIEGRVIGDDSLWEKGKPIGSWEVEDVGNYYGASASALSFHENSYSLFFKPSSVGSPALIVRTDPPFARLSFLTEVLTGHEGSGDQASIYGSEYSFVRFVQGTIPAGVSEFMIKGSVPDSARLCAEILAESLEVKGTTFEEKERTTFHTTFSPQVKEIVFWTNQKSVNLFAEHLLKAMGGGSTKAGIEAVKTFWKSQNIDLEGFNMVDGSGLSRQNFMTARQLVGVLLKMKDSKPFFDSLPLLNEKARAKSGSMSNIKCCVGYEDNVAFAILVNHHTDRQKATQIVNDYLSKLTY
ncbi:MAG TPA: D-alanyl-D-alanine carboxypeptidase/D-alanyl-D-alanine-endopeptidase [Rhabdochlamydiaceae bacterium]|nr:D-alanyl-D-alanine carboxypeptidase/D-alanyl-D-alanine-endopeptidase [Rhabdochlamydiaceae bacterium]